MIDPARLYSALLNTGLQSKDNPLYQVIYQLIGVSASLTKAVTAASGGSSSSTIINQTIQQLMSSFDGSGDSDSPIVIPGPQGKEGPIVPYFIPSTDVFTVPIFKQALFAMNIDNEGTIVVDGYLIEVDGIPEAVGLTQIIDYSDNNDNSDNLIIPGPSGPIGLTGPIGPILFTDNGIDGEFGLPGVQGIQGLKGDSGIPGLDGLEGDEFSFPLNKQINFNESVTGILGTGNGGTGTGTTFTAGSVIFAGASGVYTQDNSQFFYDITSHRIGLGTTSPLRVVDIQSADTTVTEFGLRIRNDATDQSSFFVNGSAAAGTIYGVAKARLSEARGDGTGGFLCSTGNSGGTLYLATGGTAPAVEINNARAVRFNSYGAGAATFDASGNITSVSDMRLKTKISDFTKGLKEILSIQPFIYNYNELSGLDMIESYVGLSAQEVVKSFPEFEYRDSRGYLQNPTLNLVYALINSVKELSSEINLLKGK